MKVLGRDAGRVAQAVTRADHYRALWRVVSSQPRPGDTLGRYLLGRGDYPWRPVVRTPSGPIRPTLYSQQDVFTLNEVFWRHDYGPGGQRVVVDLGANIGLSALFFLTRRPDSLVYASEPVPRNLERLRANLDGVADRVVLDERAVSVENGQAEFVIEDSGRLGGLASYSSRRDSGTTTTVPCVAIGDLLEPILTREGRIDLLKIDTEGNETALVEAISNDQRAHIGAVVYENNDGTTRWQHWAG